MGLSQGYLTLVAWMSKCQSLQQLFHRNAIIALNIWKHDSKTLFFVVLFINIGESPLQMHVKVYASKILEKNYKKVLVLQ